MHSFHHSRGRILFEVFCALALAGSLVGAWAQTDASALLSAAAIAALYGVWHLTDLRRSVPASNAAPPVPADEDQGDLLAYEPPSAPPVAEAPDLDESPAAAVAETKVKRNRKSPRPTGSGTRGRRSRPEAQPELVQVADEPEPEVAEPEPALHVVDAAPGEPAYVPATPLFETEPFVRQHRAAFGRKAR